MDHPLELRHNNWVFFLSIRLFLKVEVQVYFQNRSLIACARKHNLSVTAYGSLGSPGRVEFKLPLGNPLNYIQ